MSRTVSTRLEDEMYEKVVSRCKEKGTTVNEFLKECIIFRFDNSKLKVDESSKPVKHELSDKEIEMILGISKN